MQLSHRRGPGSEPTTAVAAWKQRGVAVIEAAFVTPVFFMLVFGIVEIALAMNDNLALAHSTRAGSRVASASGNDLYADYGIVRSIARESSAIDRGQIELVVVYQASKVGEAPSDTCQGGTPVKNECNVYRPADFARDKDDFGCKDPSSLALDSAWCPNDRRVVLTSGEGPAYVGVWMKIEHEWVTKMFGSTLTLTDTSVIQLEPRGRA